MEQNISSSVLQPQIQQTKDEKQEIKIPTDDLNKSNNNNPNSELRRSHPSINQAKLESMEYNSENNKSLRKSAEFKHPENDITKQQCIEIPLEDHFKEIEEKNTIKQDNIETNYTTCEERDINFTGPKIFSMNYCDQVTDSTLFQLAQSAPHLQQLYCKR